MRREQNIKLGVLQGQETVLVALDVYDNPAEALALLDGQHRTGSDDFAKATDTETRHMALEGWAEGLAEVMPISETALKTVEQESHTTVFEANWQLSGAEVDISRYLSEVPECMIEYEPVTVSRVGKVVTLVASITTSCGASHQQIMQRGATLTALALALEELQHSTEIWIDLSVEKVVRSVKKIGSCRIKIKGTEDSVDPAVIAFWLGHPASQRKVGFVCSYKQENETGGTGLKPDSAYVSHPISFGYPEGAILTPGLDARDSASMQNPVGYIMRTLTELGLVKAEDQD